MSVDLSVIQDQLEKKEQEAKQHKLLSSQLSLQLEEIVVQKRQVEEELKTVSG